MKEIKGIIPAMVTPFDRSSGELNEKALRKLTNYLIDGGVHGLFVVGSQGEFWAMTAEEKKSAPSRSLWMRRTDAYPFTAGRRALRPESPLP